MALAGCKRFAAMLGLRGVFIDELDSVFVPDGVKVVFVRSVRWDLLTDLLNE